MEETRRFTSKSLYFCLFPYIHAHIHLKPGWILKKSSFSTCSCLGPKSAKVTSPLTSVSLRGCGLQAHLWFSHSHCMKSSVFPVREGNVACVRSSRWECMPDMESGACYRLAGGNRVHSEKYRSRQSWDGLGASRSSEALHIGGSAAAGGFHV